jgi:urea transporter
MKPPVDYVFPPVPAGSLPYWRRTLRGCSQLCFQSNELTGLFFLAAVLVTSPISAAYMLVAAALAPAGRMLLGDRGPVLETGLAGLNPCLIALSLPAFFQTGWTNFGMWGVLLVCVALAIVMVRVFIAIQPFPILVLPFLIIFWGLWVVEPHVGVLEPGGLGIVGGSKFEPIAAVLRSLGAAAFVPTVLTGLLFLCGILLSNWRHAVIALIGAAIGTMVSYYYNHVDTGSADLGEYGFNGVLAAVSVYLMCGEKLRLAILGALLATILTPAVAALGVPALGAPFVLATWLLLALGWVEVRWFGVAEGAQMPGEPELTADTAPPLAPARNGD